jgi:hypothetical protein
MEPSTTVAMQAALLTPNPVRSADEARKRKRKRRVVVESAYGR